jgi:ankyrin repeat protein
MDVTPVALLQLLHSYGANVDHVNRMGDTALTLVSTYKQTQNRDIQEFLLMHSNLDALPLENLQRILDVDIIRF